MKGNQKKVRVISPHLSRTGTEIENDSEEEDAYHAALSPAEDRTEHVRPLASHQSPVDNENPFSEDSNEEDEYEDEFDEGNFPPQRKGRRIVPYKANQALNVDWDNPWRNSTAMGNLPGTGKRTERDATSIAPKAQRMLGMSRTGRALDQDGYRRENSLSPQTDNVAPKALRTLGIPSNPFQRPLTADNQSLHSNDEDHISIASAAHRQMDPDEFKRLLFSGHHTSAFDNGSSTDVSSNSRSSMLSSQSYRDTPRSSHEILLDEGNMRAYNRLTQRPPLSLLSSKSSRTDSLVDPAAVLTEPFSPLSSLHPDSPTDLNKPLPNTPKRPDTIFELPAQVPGTHYAPSQNAFVAELPASGPIAELPHDTSSVVELPNNEIVVSPLSAANIPRTGQMLPPTRRTGLSRSATSDYPNIPELDSPHPVELPNHPSRTNPLHHAKTIPAMHAASQQAPHAPPTRISCLPKRVDRSIIGGMPPPSTLPQGSSPHHLANIATNLPRQQPPTSQHDIPNASTYSHPSAQTYQEQSSNSRVLDKERIHPTATDEQPAAQPNDRPSTPTAPTIAAETPTSPSSPSNFHIAGLGMIAKAAVAGAQRKGSSASLNNLEPSVAVIEAEARRKASSTSLGGVGSNGDAEADIAALQRDVHLLRGKIGAPKDSQTSTMSTTHGTPPEALETGKLGQAESEKASDNEKSESEAQLEKSELQRAVQCAADEAAGKPSESNKESTVAKPITHFEESSSSDESTPKASDVEGTKQPVGESTNMF